MLILKGNHDILKFINYLSTYYSWISEPIESSILHEYTYADLTKIKDVLNFGEVPQLSSKHVSRAEHVCNNLKYYTFLYILHFVLYFILFFRLKH